jgi:hypothetical protein
VDTLMGGSSNVAQTLWTAYNGVAHASMATVIGQILPVVSAAMAGVLALMVLIAGKNMMFGELPIGEGVTRIVRALVVSALLTAGTFNTYVATFFTQTVPNQVASAMSGGQSQAGAPAFDSLINAMTNMGAHARAQMVGLLYVGDRIAVWLIEMAAKGFIALCFLVWAIAAITIYFIVPLIALLLPMWLFDRTRAFGERIIGFIIGLLLVQALALMVAAVFVTQENQLVAQYTSNVMASPPANPEFSMNAGSLSFTGFDEGLAGTGPNPLASPQQSTINTDAALEAMLAIMFTLIFGFFLLGSVTVIAFTIAATSGFSAGAIVGMVTGTVIRIVTAGRAGARP